MKIICSQKECTCKDTTFFETNVMLRPADTNKFIMNQDYNSIFQFTGGMMLASLTAFLMHPLLWILAMAGNPLDCTFLWVGVTYLLVYGFIGMFVCWKCRQLSWKKQALLAFCIINAILAIVLFVNLSWPRYVEIEGIKERRYIDAMTFLMVLVTSTFAALLSAIPISLCCYYFKKDTIHIEGHAPW